MNRTKQMLRKEVAKIVRYKRKESRFKTMDIITRLEGFTNMILTPHRIQKYIHSTGKVDYDNTRKEWIRI